jgi:hypothetical protein
MPLQKKHLWTANFLNKFEHTRTWTIGKPLADTPGRQQIETDRAPKDLFGHDIFFCQFRLAFSSKRSILTKQDGAEKRKMQMQ